MQGKEKKINFFVTSKLFPSISVTGTRCDLMCLHCKGKLLKPLIPATTCAELERRALMLYRQGAKGILLTGGCDERGRVPLKSMLPAIRKIKDGTGLIITVHTGFISHEEACALKKSGIDGIGLDVLGDMATIREVYGLDMKEEDYLESLLAIRDSGITVFPHICVGLHFGKIRGEYRALSLIRNINPATIIITGLMPIPGTPMAGIKPKPSDFAKVLQNAIEMFPSTPITLGCAHSSGKDREEIERIALQNGVAGIATPTMHTVDFARKSGYEINYYGTCCGIVADEKTRIDPNTVYNFRQQDD